MIMMAMIMIQSIMNNDEKFKVIYDSYFSIQTHPINY